MATETVPPDADVTPKGPPTPVAPASAKKAPSSPDPSTDIDTTTPDESVPVDAQPRKRGFMQTPWVQDVLPLATSIILHLGIIGLGFATYQTVKAIRQVVEQQAIIPDAAIVEGAEVGGIPNPGLGGDPTKATAQDDLKDVSTQSDAWNSKTSDSLAQSLAGAQGETTDNTIGIGPNSSFGSSKGADGTGPGGEAGGSLAPFGVPGGGGGLGPKSPFMGISGNAKKVIYICDATGTMLGVKFNLLKQQLAKAVDVLRPNQRFNVVFFHGQQTDNSWFSAFKPAMQNGTPSVKKGVYDFINGMSIVASKGGTNPIPAIENSFGQKPELIYFLTDGAFDLDASYEDVINAIAKANPDRRVRINTILLVSQDGDTKSAEAELNKAEETLKKIATDNGGTFKKVLERDLR